MILNVIDSIKEMASKVAPQAVFECDEARMINVKIDRETRSVIVTDADGNEHEVSNSFIYVEEPTYGYYDIPRASHESQRTFIRIYFCKFEEMHASAYEGTGRYSHEEGGKYRIPLRNDIEETMVRPFLYQLKHSDVVRRYPAVINSVRVLYPRARFDANEVSVGLEIMFQEYVCIDEYKL